MTVLMSLSLATTAILFWAFTTSLVLRGIAWLFSAQDSTKQQFATLSKNTLKYFAVSFTVFIVSAGIEKF